MSGGIEREVARGFSAARDALHKIKLAVFGADGKDGEGVFAAVAGVEGETIGGDS